MSDWREPYRTMDASGSPDAAENVGWNWISDLGRAEAERGECVQISDTRIEGDGKITRLYRGTTLLAVTTTFRDDMNFCVLVRWRNPSSAENRGRA